MGLFDDIQGTKKTRAAVADSGAKISGMSGGGSIDAAGRSDIVPIDARTTQNRDKGSRAGIFSRRAVFLWICCPRPLMMSGGFFRRGLTVGWMHMKCRICARRPRVFFVLCVKI